MKKTKHLPIISAVLFIVIIATSSCKKKDDTTTTVTATGSLMFHLHTNADTNEVDAYGDTLVLSSGRKLTVSMAQLYLSNIKLIKADGSVIDGPTVNVFMHQGKEEYLLGNVPIGNYKAVRFDVGLSNSTNASTPSSGDSLLYQSSMWFGAMAQPDGYVFVNFQGTIDTSAGLTGSSLVPFAYKVGTVARRVTITMPDQNFSVTQNQLSEVHMIADYAKLMNGISLSNAGNLTLTTSVQNSGSLSAQLAANISNMIRYE